MNAQLLAEQKPLGVIEVLTAGFEVVRRRPWTIWVPVLLDLFVWLLPRLSLGALLRPSIDDMFPLAGLTGDALDNTQQLHDSFAQLANSLNLFGLVSAALDSVARVPSLLSLDSGEIHSPLSALAYTLPLQSGLFALFLFIPLFLLGLFGAALYIEMIAQGVRPLVNEPSLVWLPRTAMLWLRLISFALLLGVFLLVSSIVLTLARVVSPLGADASSFIGALVAVGWFWLSIYFFFVIAAMALGNFGLLEAVRRSILIFRLYFWASLGLVILTVFLQRGLMLIWSGLAVPDFPLGILGGIILNAVIGTGLLAATMVFYQDRMNYTERLLRARVARRSS